MAYNRIPGQRLPQFYLQWLLFGPVHCVFMVRDGEAVIKKFDVLPSETNFFLFIISGRAFSAANTELIVLLLPFLLFYFGF